MKSEVSCLHQLLPAGESQPHDLSPWYCQLLQSSLQGTGSLKHHVLGSDSQGAWLSLKNTWGGNKNRRDTCCVLGVMEEKLGNLNSRAQGIASKKHALLKMVYCWDWLFMSFECPHVAEAGKQLKDRGDKAFSLGSQYGQEPRQSPFFNTQPLS